MRALARASREAAASGTCFVLVTQPGPGPSWLGGPSPSQWQPHGSTCLRLSLLQPTWALLMVLCSWVDGKVIYGTLMITQDLQC